MPSRYTLGLLILHVKARHLFLSYELKSLFLLLCEVKESFITGFKDGQIRAQISIWNYVQYGVRVVYNLSPQL